MEQFLTVDEAAKLLRVHPETVRRMIKRGQLPVVMAGNMYRIDAAYFKPALMPQPEPTPRDDPSPLARFATREFRYPGVSRESPDRRRGR